MIQAAIASAFRGCAEQTGEESDDLSSCLQQIAKEGDLEGLKKLEENPALSGVINTKNHLGCTPLRLAASEGHLDCVKYLIDLGAEVDTSDVKRQTPLLVALKNGHYECARYLLECGASPEGDYSHMVTPLYVMTMQGSYMPMKLLLKYGALPDGTMKDFIPESIQVPNYPLHVAITYKHAMCVRLLLQYGANVFLMSNTHVPASLAVEKGRNPEILQLLFAAGADVPKYLKSFLQSCDNKEIQESPMSLCEMPRSLKSSCRLCVIQNCVKNIKMSVDELELPGELKDYLLFNDIFIPHL